MIKSNKYEIDCQAALKAELHLLQTYAPILSIYILPINDKLWQGVICISQGLYRNASLAFWLQVVDYPIMKICFCTSVYHPLVDQFSGQVDMKTLMLRERVAHTSHLFPLLNKLKSMFIDPRLLGCQDSLNPQAGREFTQKKHLFIEKAMRTANDSEPKQGVFQKISQEQAHALSDKVKTAVQKGGSKQEKVDRLLQLLSEKSM